MKRIGVSKRCGNGFDVRHLFHAARLGLAPYCSTQLGEWADCHYLPNTYTHDQCSFGVHRSMNTSYLGRRVQSRHCRHPVHHLPTSTPSKFQNSLFHQGLESGNKDSFRVFLPYCEVNSLTLLRNDGFVPHCSYRSPRSAFANLVTEFKRRLQGVVEPGKQGRCSRFNSSKYMSASSIVGSEPEFAFVPTVN